MNEVTKLYENAKVDQKRMCEWTCKDSEVCNTLCEHYESTQVFYPPFTAEKQLELIKWLGKLAGKLEISSNYNDTQYLLYFYMGRKTRDEILPNISTGRSEKFEESLAGLINNLWQDLTDAEKAQIKNILESEVRE